MGCFSVNGSAKIVIFLFTHKKNASLFCFFSRRQNGQGEDNVITSLDFGWTNVILAA